MLSATSATASSLLLSPAHPCPRRRSLTISCTSVSPSTSSTTAPLPIQDIPGGYGLPLVGPIRDRLDFLYFQGREEFFKSRIQKHQSTVFRTNMPPGPFVSGDPRVVALLDAASFPVLFDLSKVEKRDLFSGTYMPSTDLTGGHRVLSYLDPSEPNHGPLKSLLFHLLKSSRPRVIPEFQARFNALFSDLEAGLAAAGKAAFNDPCEAACFEFLGCAFFGLDPSATELGRDGPKQIAIWVLLQIGPILSLGLPWPLEEALLRTLPLPPILARSALQRLHHFISAGAASSGLLDEASRLGIGTDEAVYNLLFATCFNTFGGMKILFPGLVKLIGRAGAKLHVQLAQEVRSAIAANGGEVTMRAIEAMPLVKSVAYEALRLEPPVPFQYGRAKRDLVVESHDAAFRVKRGEMLFGYQPLATRDPKMFERAEEFVAERFVGAEGERLLRYVVWSNGPETEQPTVDNKQCAGKDFVGLVSRLLVVELFRRYDSFDIEVGSSTLGASITFTSLKRATF